MKILLLVITYLFFAGKAFAEEPNCSENEVFHGLMFELAVNNSLRDDMVFRFCVGKDVSFLVSELYQTAYVSEDGIRPALNYHSKVRLTSETKSKIDDLYKNALLNSRPDNVRGLDGSTWCFRPKSGNSYTELCYWSPIEHPGSERGLKDISNLGIYLFDISGLQEYGGVFQ
ncbi:hypothetical protein [Rheinheimera pleomorphica]|uniref:hypothetical protein n=1 Tax=Rheinheimera pleomorphica TaxID=2703963 RepID=UPI0014204DB5|nr:hypothetical protein [Rheinheimera pleomorphica]